MTGERWDRGPGRDQCVSPSSAEIGGEVTAREIQGLVTHPRLPQDGVLACFEGVGGVGSRSRRHFGRDLIGQMGEGGGASCLQEFPAPRPSPMAKAVSKLKAEVLLLPWASREAESWR